MCNSADDGVSWGYEETSSEAKAMDILARLLFTVTTHHVDMGGKYRYNLTMKSHSIITEAKALIHNEK